MCISRLREGAIGAPAAWGLQKEAQPVEPTDLIDSPITRGASPKTRDFRDPRILRAAALGAYAKALPLTQFTDLGLAKPLLKALADEGYTTPTPIQAQAIPGVMAGRDHPGAKTRGAAPGQARGITVRFAAAVLPIHCVL